MALSRGFIEVYTKLQNERDSGDNIWMLCELSSDIVAPRGCSNDRVTLFFRDRINQEEGASRELAEAVRCEVDTIERRAFAWRSWMRFVDISDLRDADDNEIDFTHFQIRERLFYTHFSEVGRKAESALITPEQAAVYLVESVRNNWSVSRLRNEIKVFTDTKEDFMREWRVFRAKSRSLRRWPHLPRRVNRLLKELEAYDMEPPD